MLAYVYKAALWCQDCGSELCSRLPTPPGYKASDEGTWDSDTYPKGPYANGGGEADTPQHCDGCGLFLENPLTPEGLEATRQYVAKEDPTLHSCVAVWKKFYL